MKRYAYRRDPYTEVETHTWGDGTITSRFNDGRANKVRHHFSDGLIAAVFEAEYDLVPLQARVEGWVAVRLSDSKIVSSVWSDRSALEKVTPSDARIAYLREAPGDEI